VVVDSRGGVVYCKVTSLAGTNPSLDIDAVLS